MELLNFCNRTFMRRLLQTLMFFTILLLPVAADTTTLSTTLNNHHSDVFTVLNPEPTDQSMGEGYALWIGETQVTMENCVDILGDGKQTFMFNPTNNTLSITNNQDEAIEIESRLDELTIYLNGNKANKLKKIFYNNLGNAENKGKLVFKTNYNNPGSVDFKNDQGESVITGFESVEFDSNSKLTFVLPEKTTYAYENGAMNKIVEVENSTTTTPADELSIGQSLASIDNTVTITLSDLYLRDEEGNVIINENSIPLSDSVIKDVLFTTPGSNDDNSGDGVSIDDSDGRVELTLEITSMTDDKVMAIAQKVISDDDYFPGSNAFAEDFVGMTILLPASAKSITTDLEVSSGYEFHALIAEEDNAGNLKSTVKVLPKGKVETPFNVAMPSYCYIYIVSTDSAVKVTPPTEITEQAYRLTGSQFPCEYDLSGHKVDTNHHRRGIYIKNCKKIMIK